MGRHELAKARDQYAKLSLKPRRLLRFWRVRPGRAGSEAELRGMTNQSIIPGRCKSIAPEVAELDHAALIRSASRCFSRGITSCFRRRSELCQASGLCL